MQIRKRNGVVVIYDGSKIIRAVESAMSETELGVDDVVSRKVENAVKLEVMSSGTILTVEQVQDLVELFLAEYDRFDVAKRYVIYREERRKSRKNVKRFSLLTDEFISKYKHQPDPFPTELGKFTYYRTYSRFIPEEGRRERWWEAVARAVDFNCSLSPTTTKAEAELLYDNVYNFRQFLSGRTLFTGGTKASKLYPLSNFNCSFSVINSFEALRDGFYLMMVGAGFGFRVLRSDVEKLPRVRKDVCIVNKQVKKVPKSQRQEITTINIKQGYIAEIVIGDDKMAWAESVRMLFEILTSSAYRNINTVLINYDHIRPKGERLKTFGGYASGEEALIKIFTKIDEVIQGSDGVEKDGKIALKPIDIMDIANIIAVGVVSGGTRRSSEICLFDIDDTDVRNAKTNLYTLKDGNWVLDDAIEHRRLSNNSIYFRSKPAYDFLAKCINDVRYSGEPGVVNEVAAAKRRPNFNGVNPCAEILLDSKGLCNLTELNVMAFVTALGEFLLDEAIKAQRMSARAGIRMNLPTLELHEWDIIAKRDNLIGCSLSGWQDMVNATGMSKEEQIRVLELLKQVAREEAESYAKELGMNAPLLVTTVKPSGTLSLLPTVSSGVHFSHSEYYIRRVRVSRHDPLAQLMIELGYPVFPEVGQEWETCDTVVVEFPVKSTGGKTKSHVSAIEQLEIYKMFMEHYVEHNVSITVHVRDNEWDAVTNWMYDNWDDVVAVSFLSYDDSFYQLLPYEEITKEEYTKRLKDLPKLDISQLSKYEIGEDFELDASDCSSGVCPIR